MPTADVLERIGSCLRATRDAVTFSSLCKTAACMRWRGEVIVTPRWVSAMPPRWPAALTVDTLTFKRHGVYDKEHYPAELHTLRYICCRVPLPKLISLTADLQHLHHLHLHQLDCTDSRAVPGGVEHILELPNLRVVDITLASAEERPLIFVTPSRLSRTLHTCILNRAGQLWVEDADWPSTLERLEFGHTESILMRQAPPTLKTLVLHSDSHLGLDEDDMLQEARQLETVYIRTRGAFGLSWIRHNPHIRALVACSDTIIVDESLAYPKDLRFLYLESFAYFATTHLSQAVYDRIKSIPHVEFRAMGGKCIDLV